MTGTLYGIVNLQNRAWPNSDFEIWRSSNHGQTWERAGWRFSGTSGAIRPLTFVNFGAGQAAPDGYVYLTALTVSAAAGQHAVFLMRAHKDSLFAQGAYTYFAGTDDAGAATWSGNPAAAVAIFQDPNGLDGPEIVWDAPLGRFLLTASHTSADKVGVFELATMWGGWSTLDYEIHWLGMTGGQFLGLQFPTAWMAADGGTLWATFSCYSATACPAFSDRFNLIRVTLTPAGGGSSPSPGSGSHAKSGRKGTTSGGTKQTPAPNASPAPKNTSPAPSTTGSAPPSGGTGQSSRPTATTDHATGASLANVTNLATVPPAAPSAAAGTTGATAGTTASNATAAPAGMAPAATTAATGSSVGAQRAAASADTSGAATVGTVYVAAGSSGSTPAVGTGAPPPAPAPTAPETAAGTPEPVAPRRSGRPPRTRPRPTPRTPAGPA